MPQSEPNRAKHSRAPDADHRFWSQIEADVAWPGSLVFSMPLLDFQVFLNAHHHGLALPFITLNGGSLQCTGLARHAPPIGAVTIDQRISQLCRPFAEPMSPSALPS